jgi:hypothetical protein
MLSPRVCTDWIVIRLIMRISGSATFGRLQYPRNAPSFTGHDAALRCAMVQKSTRSAAGVDDATAVFVTSGVSINIASRDLALRPSVARCCGCRIDRDRRELRVLMVRRQTEPVLNDLAVTGEVAAVFSEVDSHRTLQIKASGARVDDADADDLAAARKYQRDFAASLDAIGHLPAFTEMLLGVDENDLVVVVMQPSALFVQTPGPGAGQRLVRPA